jgi:hypothetical protein
MSQYHEWYECIGNPPDIDLLFLLFYATHGWEDTKWLRTKAPPVEHRRGNFTPGK